MIRLKKLYIYGFKSFADKSEFIFEHNITAIVGPNGCGKSNIVDAINWVFQNYGLRNLRANEKQDLIFKGNDYKPAAGFAEVEVFFGVYDKAEENFIEKEEFSIKKRMYPSGEVVYYINKTECRPKDIQDILNKYSIASLDYSIIAQGSVSKLISMRPEERVEMIETAAGLKQIKQDRTKAINELQKVEENLKSISLLAIEIEEEAKRLEVQAKKASEYKNSANILEFSEQALHILKYKKLLQNLSKLETDFNESNTIYSDLENQSKQLDEENRQYQNEIKELQAKIDEKKENIYKIDSEISIIEQTIALSQKRYEELTEEQKKKDSDFNFFQNRLQKLDEFLSFSLEELQTEYEQLISQNDELELKLSDINIQLSEYQDKIKKLNSEIDKLSFELKDNYKKQEKFVADELQSLFSSLYNIKFRIGEISANLNQTQNILLQDKTKLSGIINRIDDFLKYIESQDIESIKKNLTVQREEIIGFFEDLKEFEQTLGLLNIKYKEFEDLLFGKDTLFSRYQQYQNAIELINEQLDTKKENKEGLQKFLDSINQTQQTILKKKIELQRKISALEENIKNARQNKKRYENEKVEVAFNIKQKEEEIKLNNSAMEKIKQDALSLMEKRDSLFKTKKEQALEINKIDEEIKNIYKKLDDLENQNEMLIRKKYEVVKLKENYSISRAKIETELDTIRNLFFESYRIVLNEQMIEDRKYDGLKESELRNNIINARKSIDEIGQTNFLAITEYEEAKKRLDFINKQREDILNSKEKLNILIETLDKNLNSKFLEAFNTINENFSNIFKEVFRGGNAQMVLTKPDDFMNTGIEIVIQPPGKNITNISLLSGGETALSALALLFAFFLYKPSCFCILDEVDAPFDENNINLLKRLILRFAKDTQFFIISHNKLTLEIADILYGVTMEKDGISKILSVKLEDIIVDSSK